MKWEEVAEKIKRERAEMMAALPTREKLLEQINQEGLVSEFLTLEETGEGLSARDNFRQQFLWLARDDSGKTSVTWTSSDGVLRKDEYDDPSRAYYEFLMEMRDSVRCLEEARAKAEQEKPFRKIREWCDKRRKKE